MAHPPTQHDQLPITHLEGTYTIVDPIEAAYIENYNRWIKRFARKIVARKFEFDIVEVPVDNGAKDEAGVEIFSKEGEDYFILPKVDWINDVVEKFINENPNFEPESDNYAAKKIKLGLLFEAINSYHTKDKGTQHPFPEKADDVISLAQTQVTQPKPQPPKVSQRNADMLNFGEKDFLPVVWAKVRDRVGMGKAISVEYLTKLLNEQSDVTHLSLTEIAIKRLSREIIRQALKENLVVYRGHIKGRGKYRSPNTEQSRRERAWATENTDATQKEKPKKRHVIDLGVSQGSVMTPTCDSERPATVGYESPAVPSSSFDFRIPRNTSSIERTKIINDEALPLEVRLAALEAEGQGYRSLDKARRDQGRGVYGGKGARIRP